MGFRKNRPNVVVALPVGLPVAIPPSLRNTEVPPPPHPSVKVEEKGEEQKTPRNALVELVETPAEETSAALESEKQDTGTHLLEETEKPVMTPTEPVEKPAPKRPAPSTSTKKKK